jgi:5-formyltetrahydrofolate cyclo-ligase
MSETTIAAAKQVIRERVWTRLEAERAVEPGVHGSIPAFVGAEEAATRLAGRAEWTEARVVKANPDRAQLPVRVRALNDGKLVYMAVPRMADVDPVYLLDPATLTAPFEQIATGRGAAKSAALVGTGQMRPVDLIVCGSVAVNRTGARLGKGAGYADIEVALLKQAGLIGHTTTVVATVHPLQIVEDDLPEIAHDFSVDLIVTPDEIIECGPPRRPAGILWEHLDPAQIEAIPVLADMQQRRGGRA